MRIVLPLLVVIGLAIAGVVYYVAHVAAAPATSFRTATVTRGELLATISATGTVESQELVDVGAQVVGRIKDLGIDPSELDKAGGPKPAEQKAGPTGSAKDGSATDSSAKKVDPSEPNPEDIRDQPNPSDTRKRVDYTSIVHPGTRLAYIDPTIYQAQVDQARAALNRAVADLKQLQAKREQAKADWARAQRLRPDRALAEKTAAPQSSGTSDSRLTLDYRAMSDADYDLAKASYDVAEANVAVGGAAIEQGKAALKMAETNLAYTVIKSPVEGVIIDRRVNIGQTVVSSLNAPSLFLIAKDLSKMQVWASVNEADIGKIRGRQQMPVRFTVDAYPGEVFRGKVSQIRLNATMTQNVVTYTVVIDTDNRDGRLLPYLTANVQFEVEKRDNVLQVPNAALRWRPRPEQVAPDVRETAFPAGAGKGGAKGGPPAAKSPGDPPSAKTAKDPEDRGRVWINDGNFVRPVEVQIGATDGSMTEISGKDLKEGMEVVTGENRRDSLAQGSDTTNPFTPKLRFGRAKGQP